MTDPARAWSSVGPRTASALIAVGAFVTSDAILAHLRRVTAPRWLLILAITLGASAMVAGAIRLYQTPGSPSKHAIAKLARRWTPFFVAALVYFTALVIMAPYPTGDQTHYELGSVGLAYDQTRDMTKSYTVPERYLLVSPVVPTYAGEAFRYKPGGELVLVENVGLPLLLAPAVPWVKEVQVLGATSWVKQLGLFRPERRRWPWNFEMILFAALAAQLLYRILRRLRPDHPRLVAGVWASVVFSAPMVVYASSIYPEIPAVLLALVAVDALLQPPSRRTIVLGACACALLPWLQVRYLPIAALLVLGLAIHALTVMPARQRRTGVGVRSAAWAILPLVLSLVVMATAFQHWYGSPLPNAPYRLPQISVFTPHTLSASWETLAGAFWSSERGWLPFAPVGILALAGIGYAVRRYRAWAIFGLAVAGAYLLDLTIQGSQPGFSFPGRYEVILMPFAALPLLIAAADLAPVRVLLWLLAAVSLSLTLAIVLEPPPTVIQVGGPSHQLGLWTWFVHTWPAIVNPTASDPYPDAGTALTWSFALLAVSVAGYFVFPRATRAALRPRLDAE
jgi:hypothetical protein